MYAVLDFESKNLIAGNKKPYLPQVVDFSKFSQVVAGSLFIKIVLDKECFDIFIFPGHHVRVLHRALFLKTFYAQKLIVCWTKLLKI